MLPKRFKYPILFLLSIISLPLSAQNSQSKWYFGANAALDFMSAPPSPILNSAMIVGEGCASIADESGSLLFYTDGQTVYNKSHAVMANGNGLFGDFTPAQSTLIVQKPGSTQLFYVFTIRGAGNTPGFHYSIVDMSLAGGQGSVTVKNTLIYSGSCREALTGVLHCNGIDYWLIIRELMTNNFHSYLLSNSGLNSTAIISTVGPSLTTGIFGALKASQDGSKIAFTSISFPSNLMLVLDFDNTNGSLSNPLALPSNGQGSYGIEFSPDGSKLYSTNNNGFINQWDLCSNVHFTLSAKPGVASMQLANNGKIYIAVASYDSLSVIDKPNLSGPAFDYIQDAQFLGGNNSNFGLPNFIKSYKVELSPFTHNISPSDGCHAMSFAAHLPTLSCTVKNHTVTYVSWNFGDAASGALNQTTGLNPVHVFSSSGNFTVSLILHYNCLNDTIRQVVNIPPPDIVVTLSSNCTGQASGTVQAIGGLGPYTYTWLPSSQNSTVANNLPVGTNTVSLTDQGLGCTISTLIAVSNNPIPTLSLQPSGLMSVCAGNSTTVQLLSNCSSHTLYPSANVNLQNNLITINTNASQTYTVAGSLLSCTIATVFSVNVLPLPIASIAAENTTVCLNTELTLKGSGGKTYQWNGPAGFSSNQQNINHLINGNDQLGTYFLQVSDENGCKNSSSILIQAHKSPDGAFLNLKSEGCLPLCSEFEFVPVNGSESTISTWEINSLLFSGKFEYCFTAAGSYTAIGKLLDTVTTCSSKFSQLIQVYPKPNADYKYEPIELYENMSDPIIFTNTSEGENQEKWTWHFYSPDRMVYPARAEGQITFNNFLHSGSYISALVVSNKWGCADTIIKDLVVKEDYNIWVPNSFTPNGDFKNDQFIPVTRGIKFFKLQIFNRFGKLIFQSSDSNHGWDGSYNGEIVQDGVYTWILTTTSQLGKEEIRSGFVLSSK